MVKFSYLSSEEFFTLIFMSRSCIISQIDNYKSLLGSVPPALLTSQSLLDNLLNDWQALLASDQDLKDLDTVKFVLE